MWGERQPEDDFVDICDEDIMSLWKSSSEQSGRGGIASKFGTALLTSASLQPLIFVRTMCFMSSGLPRRNLL